MFGTMKSGQYTLIADHNTYAALMKVINNMHEITDKTELFQALVPEFWENFVKDGVEILVQKLRSNDFEGKKYASDMLFCKSTHSAYKIQQKINLPSYEA